MRTSTRFVLIVFVALAAARPSSAALTRIGAAAAVAGGVTATSEGEAVGHVLSSGKPVFLNDHVVSDAKGRLQVLLLDETVFTLGANADMVLDEFVYDPNTNAGKVTARVVSGAFRFVTGKMAAKDPGQMKVKAGVATIGIRGTIVACSVTAQGTTCVLLGPGQNTSGSDRVGSIRVESEGRTVEINRAGFATVVEVGRPPSPPFRLAPDAVRTMFGALAGAPPSNHDQQGKEGDNKVVVDEAKMKVISTILALADTNADLNKAQNNSSLTNTASQESTRENGATSGISSWEDLRVLTGAATYSGSGTYSFTSAANSLAQTGNWEFHLNVDFTNRTVGGMTTGTTGSSSSYLRATSGPVAYPTNLNPSSDWSRTSFDSLTGNATLTQKSSSTPGPGEIQGNNSAFDGTKIQFNTVDRTAAHEVQVDMQYSSTNGTASGTAKAPCTNTLTP
ncbi:MAG: FecR domain-containing protein [Elusimicrobia bacterium]|nr:FecR domain-containing protein [Elusimicrobiota bacterium]